jgi:hypothetical protein
MKVLHVAEEKFGYIADFAGRQRDTVFTMKSASNLFALAVMDKSLKSNECHDIITHGSASNDMLSKGNRPSCNKSPRSISTPGCANMDGFTNLKLTMTHRLPVMRNRLLDMQWTSAYRAGSWLVTN